MELQCPPEENSCLNRKRRSWKEQGKIELIILFLTPTSGGGDLVVFFPDIKDMLLQKGFIIILIYTNVHCNTNYMSLSLLLFQSKTSVPVHPGTYTGES